MDLSTQLSVGKKMFGMPALLCGLFLFCLVLAIPRGASAQQLVGQDTNPGFDTSKPHLEFKPREARIRHSRKPYRATEASKGRGDDVELGGSNESSVAVNPLDPMNVAYASCVELRVSNDGGATFGPPVLGNFPPTHTLAGDPVVLFDSEGRLFWQFLGWLTSGEGIDIFIAQCDPVTGEILPGYPVCVSEQAGIPGYDGNFNDKPWMVVDAWDGSPYQNNLYIAWTNFPGSGSVVYASRSEDQGLTWSNRVRLTFTSSMFDWPVHMAVASNGDVYCAEHYGTNITSRIKMYRSSDGGSSYSGVGDPYPNGMAYLGTNYQGSTSSYAADFWFQGSFQPWILPDPADPGTLCVVACSDPNGQIGNGDDGNIYIVRSTDYGQTWSSRQRVDSDPGNFLQVFPAASVDPQNGNIAVTWYDAREEHFNGNNNYLLNTYAAVSFDGGLTFEPDFRIDDEPFDPDAGAPCRFDCGAIFYSCWVADSGVAYVGGEQFLYWDGSVWSTVDSGPDFDIYGIWGTAENSVWVAGESGIMYFFNGVSWQSQYNGVYSTLSGIHGRSADDVYSVGDGGVIIHWDGSSWTSQESGTNEDLWHVYAVPDGSVWAVGDGGTVIKNSGTGWQSVTPVESGELLLGVWASSDEHVWVPGVSGAIYRWDGTQWTTMNVGGWFFSSVWGTSENSLYFGGWGQTLHWDGDNFTFSSFSENQDYSIYGNSDSHVFSVGDNGDIGHFNGVSWQVQDNPGLASSPTKRIGEYNGIAASGVVAVTTWTGNTRNDENQAVDQQSMFDTLPLESDLSSVTIEEATSLVFLEPGRPNPFRCVTNFSFSLPRSQTVVCGVYDVRGHLVREIQDGFQTEGRHSLTWDGRDAFGGTVGAGTYFLRLETGGQRHTQKLTLVR